MRVLRRLTGLDMNGVDALLDAPGQIVPRLISGPLSLRIATGAPRVSMISASARVTRRLGMDVSTSSAKHSRV